MECLASISRGYAAVVAARLKSAAVATYVVVVAATRVQTAECPSVVAIVALAVAGPANVFASRNVAGIAVSQSVPRA